MTSEEFQIAAKGKSVLIIDRKLSGNRGREVKSHILWEDNGRIYFRYESDEHMMEVINNPFCDCKLKFE